MTYAKAFLFAGAVTALCARPAKGQSERWLGLLEDQQYRISFDTTTVRVYSETLVEAWVQYMLVTPEPTTGGKGKKKAKTSTMNLQAIDCRFPRKSAVVRSIDYFDDQSNNELPYTGYLAWKESIPDTYGELVAQRLCNWAHFSTPNATRPDYLKGH